MLADPPPVLLELAIQVDAHVPLKTGARWLDGAQRDFKEGKVS